MTLSAARTPPDGGLGLVHGLVIKSQVALTNSLPVQTPQSPSVTIRYRSDVVTAADGAATLACMSAGPHRYSVSRLPDGSHRLHVPSVLVADIDGTGSQVLVAPDPRTPPGEISLVVSGLLLSVVLTIRGEPLLHASAVECSGHALGIAGPSGTGKSSLAAMMVVAGGRLVSDDQLRVDLTDGHAYCWPSAVHVRARDGGLGPSIAAAVGARRRSPDGRLLIDSRLTTRDRPTLSGLVIPLLDPEAANVQAEPLRGVQAATALLAARALPGRLAPQWESSFFHHMMDIATTVPVWVARIPWRRDHVRKTGQELLQLLSDAVDG